MDSPKIVSEFNTISKDIRLRETLVDRLAQLDKTEKMWQDCSDDEGCKVYIDEFQYVVPKQVAMVILNQVRGTYTRLLRETDQKLSKWTHKGDERWTALM